MSNVTEGYPADWTRVTLMISPKGEIHAIGGDRAEGPEGAETAYLGLEMILSMIRHDFKPKESPR